MRRQKVELAEVAGLLPLIKAAKRSAKASRHRLETQRFMAELEKRCGELSDALLTGTYAPQAFRHFMIRDPKSRWISAAPFADRVVHHSVCHALEPKFEKYAYDHSYACRKGKGTHQAIAQVQKMSRQGEYVLKLDIKHYFETLPHQKLQLLIRKLIKGKQVLALCDQLIEHAPTRHKAGYGLPIGNLTSQHFANLYLGQLDHFIASQKALPKVLSKVHYVRYMDDLVLIANKRQDLHYLEAQMSQFVQCDLGLQLKSSARQLTHISQGIPFLGCRIWPKIIRLDQARKRRLHRKLKALHNVDIESIDYQARLTSIHSWAEYCGALSLMSQWHKRRFENISDYFKD